MLKRNSRGIRNNNPLNIRVGNKWKHERVSTSEREFEVFDEMKWGIRAGFMVLFRYIDFYRLKTIPSIIKRWAPPSENITTAYIDTVCGLTGFPEETKIEYTQKGTMCKIFKAMAVVETGVKIDDDLISEGYDLAFADFVPTKRLEVF